MPGTSGWRKSIPCLFISALTGLWTYELLHNGDAQLSSLYMLLMLIPYNKYNVIYNIQKIRRVVTRTEFVKGRNGRRDSAHNRNPT